ncbi:MAG: hypothetical protein K6E89_03195 [Sphaerochaetaceae bacterium]|nr:hypothetical protein [Sphaerochaetaceae bacterium]
MRKILIIFLTILLLLVSCATKEVKQDEPEMEVVEAAVVETPAPVVAQEPALEPEIPQEETVPESEPEIVDFEPTTEEPVAEQEVTETEPASEEPVSEQPAEEDWSMVITASAPVEQPAAEEPEVKETAEAKETVEETKPAEEKASVAKTPAATSAPASAKKPSFVDKVTDTLKKIGQFIMREKLLSIGFLTCIIGVIYLIIALVKSRRPRDRFDSYNRPEEQYYEDQEPESFEEKPAPKTRDTEPESEDDEFLRSLLGDDKY